MSVYIQYIHIQLHQLKSVELTPQSVADNVAALISRQYHLKKSHNNILFDINKYDITTIIDPMVILANKITKLCGLFYAEFYDNNVVDNNNANETDCF